MNQNRYCHYCQHQGFCAIYQAIYVISGLLVNNLHATDGGENGYQIVINEIAHNCKQFKHFEEVTK